MNETTKVQFNFKFTLTGEVIAIYEDQKIKITKSQINVNYDENNDPTITLTAEIDPEDIKKLIPYFSQLIAYEEGYYSFKFEMKPEIINKYKDQYTGAVTVDDYLNAGNGACLDLTNYICLGYGKI